MTVSTVTIPAKLAERGLAPTPFRLMVPRELSQTEARQVWEALAAYESETTAAVRADPFALAGVSTVFPGVLYTLAAHHEQALSSLAAHLNSDNDLQEFILTDAWVELWVPDSLAPEAAPLDVVDLTAS